METSRTIVIGDIHGCHLTFQALLAKLALAPTDTLYLLGDYIDRGPGSKGVIETILGLKARQFDLRPILGNHEQMLLDSICSESVALWLANGGDETLRSYGARHPWDFPRRHVAFLEALPLCRSTDTHVFVHAGLDLRLADPFSADGATAMLWARHTMPCRERIGGRTLVTGHTPMDLDQIRASLATDHIYLDNGCVFGGMSDGEGNLVALVLETGELVLQKKID